jgi:hypothetical protein
MSARYPHGIHKGSFPSTVEVVTAHGDVYGAPVLTGPAVSIPARVTRTRIEDVDTQPAAETNRVKIYSDGIKAYLPPVAPALALKVASVLRYQGLVYTVVQAKQG